MRKIILPLVLIALAGCNEDNHNDAAPPEFLDLKNLQTYKESFLQFAESDTHSNPNPDLPESAQNDFEGLWIAQQKYRLNYAEDGYHTSMLVYEKTIFSIEKTEEGNYRVSSCNSAHNATVLTGEELAVAVQANVNIVGGEKIEPVSYTELKLLPHAKVGDNISNSSISTVYAGAFKVSGTPGITGETRFVDEDESVFVPQCIQLKYSAEHEWDGAYEKYQNDFSLLIGLPDMYLIYDYWQIAGNGLPTSGVASAMYNFSLSSSCYNSRGSTNIVADISTESIKAEAEVCGFNVSTNAAFY
jgi:hypothetical protein